MTWSRAAILLWTEGSGITQITNTTGTWNAYSISINANGTRIAFASNGDLTGANPDGNYEIFLWTSGAGITQITNSADRWSSSPSINADGRRITFRSVSNLTGGNLVREIDQRHVTPSSLVTEEVYIGGEGVPLPPGTHRITFRIDGFGASASGVELTNVELGLVAVSSKLGVFRGGNWFLDLNGNGTWDGCGTDGCIFGWGMAGDPARWRAGSSPKVRTSERGTAQTPHVRECERRRTGEGALRAASGSEARERRGAGGGAMGCGAQPVSVTY